MTKLESVVAENARYASLSANASKQERQSMLDAITGDVMQNLTSEEISAHVREIYDATISEYIANPHNRYIVDELVEFMGRLPENARVLDMGCGTGRDVLFMSVPDEKFREELMGRIRMGKTTREKFPVPTATFQVVGIDSSSEMLFTAQKWQYSLIEKGLLKRGMLYPHFQREDITENLEHLGKFDCVWSCAALFTHTPKSCLASTFGSIAIMVKENGLFVTTYTNGLAEGEYDKLLLSSTGRIKYFSHPNPNEIAEIAKQHGFVLESEQFSDFEVGDKILKKDLFVSQFFKKS